jgi:hypothetical protein
MQTVLHLIKLAAILAAAMMLGNWFLSEVKAARATQKPWYTPYLSLPGITIIVIAIALPLLLWYWRQG